METKEEQLERIRRSMSEWKQKERELAVSKNFEGLILFYMEKWKKSAMYEIPTLYHKISFYYGRLGDPTAYELYVKNECQILIGMMATEKDTKTGLHLFVTGMKYPYFSEQDLEVIDELYSDENYYELMDSLYIEENLLPRPLKKFDKSLLSITHSEFSKELLDEVYTSFLENNDNPDWINVKVYDRPSNSIRVVRSGDEVANKTQFIIDLGLLFNEFLDLLEEFFGSELKERYMNGISDDSGMKEDTEGWAAGEYAFSVFELFVKSNSVTRKNDAHIFFRRKLARNWLEKINSLKRN